jgi:hypothetical protein
MLEEDETTALPYLHVCYIIHLKILDVSYNSTPYISEITHFIIIYYIFYDNFLLPI